MSWYYYSGRVVRPVMVEKGRSVSVRPNTKVEIIDESTIEFKSLCRRGFFRRTSRPKDLNVDKKNISDKTFKDVIKKSKMAKLIAEKGVTKAMDVPPVSKVKVELTEGEMENISLDETSEEKKVDILDVVQDEALPNIEIKKEEKKKKRR
jgi:hypothetical protein